MENFTIERGNIDSKSNSKVLSVEISESVGKCKLSHEEYKALSNILFKLSDFSDDFKIHVKKQNGTKP
jgi:hypothetical protein